MHSSPVSAPVSFSWFSFISWFHRSSFADRPRHAGENERERDFLAVEHRLDATGDSLLGEREGSGGEAGGRDGVVGSRLVRQEALV
jgi:hypothetical protein